MNPPTRLESLVEYNRLTCEEISAGTWTHTPPQLCGKDASGNVLKCGEITRATITGQLGSGPCAGKTFTFAAIYYEWTAHNNQSNLSATPDKVADTFDATWTAPDGSTAQYTFNITVPVVRPDHETTVFEDWWPDNPTVGEWQQTLVPPSSDPTFDFSGESVQEAIGGAGHDSCYFSGSHIDPAIAVTGGPPGRWPVQSGNGWRITYEDPPYSRYSDITVVTDIRLPGAPVQSPSQLQALQGNKSRLVPKGGRLSFTLPSADPDELGTVEALVKSYNASRGGSVFAVVQGAGLLHVVPRQMTGLSGNIEPLKPVLDTIITIEPKERTAYALLDEIFKKISIATNTDVVMGTVPINMLSQTKTSIGGSGKTARSILEQWILESRAPLSWRLLYGPDVKWYALNIHVVASVKKP